MLQFYNTAGYCKKAICISIFITNYNFKMCMLTTQNSDKAVLKAKSNINNKFTFIIAFFILFNFQLQECIMYKGNDASLMWKRFDFKEKSRVLRKLLFLV